MLAEHVDSSIDRHLDVIDLVTCLTAIFERLQDDDVSAQVNVPLSVDLVLNWLLNVYDRLAKLFSQNAVC